MTQDELWLAKWQEAIDFLETNHRKPSKFIPEERNLRSWWKHNKKLMNAGELKLERICTDRIELSPNGPVVALAIQAGQWHTVRALESGYGGEGWPV